ncbi:MAG TPA: hypothetical protein D7I11_07250 [Candidatus Poseidoniales archaeon]|nr:hypothetical protein [Euryarchaeota archaeon]DAC53154.1 MAG TPA: hypothetical protein D7I11_07250 [Candidatus Poseidoniales archaeon]HII28206.1 hypothetical protein [Poseidonia sp.]|tara:strand:- start:121 stop:756 length:636 start_codon:yes stop_codon:yes gene_type:complete
MNEEQLPQTMLLVGVGGIGTQLAELLVAALRRVNLRGDITLMDADVVEASNLGHQRFTANDIGRAKVACLAQRLDDETSALRVNAVVENLRREEQVAGYDLVVVCVDRPEPRRLVHGLGVPWLDVRCSGDGWMVLSSDSHPALLERMTPDHEPASCQVAGALDAGNLEFGFAVAAAFGAQWALQTWRGRTAPVQSMGSLTYGALSFPEVKA